MYFLSYKLIGLTVHEITAQLEDNVLPYHHQREVVMIPRAVEMLLDEDSKEEEEDT